RGERTKNLGLADRQPLRIARLVEEDGNLFVPDPRSGAEASSPFLDDDAALLVDLLGVERQSGGEITERGKALGHDVRLVGRQVEHVDRLFKARVRVHMRAEARTGRFEVR